MPQKSRQPDTKELSDWLSANTFGEEGMFRLIDSQTINEEICYKFSPY
jgi:hypothetical protein